LPCVGPKSTPADSVEEGLKPGWVVELTSDRTRKRGLGKNDRPRLDFPEDRQFVTERVVFDRGQFNEMRRIRTSSKLTLGRVRPDHVRHDPVAIADLHQLPDFRGGYGRGELRDRLRSGHRSTESAPMPAWSLKHWCPGEQHGCGFARNQTWDCINGRDLPSDLLVWPNSTNRLFTN